MTSDGQPQMQRSGDVSLRARVRKRSRNLKPAKDANRRRRWKSGSR